jgi:hypothetical protein
MPRLVPANADIQLPFARPLARERQDAGHAISCDRVILGGGSDMDVSTMMAISPIIIEDSEIGKLFLFFCFIDCLALRIRTRGLFGAPSEGLASEPRVADSA